MVWVDDWQMQCCGEPFAVGQEVVWTLSAAVDAGWLSTVLGPETAREIAYREEHHGRLPDDTPETRGRIVGIQAARCRFDPVPDGDGRTLHPVPGSGEVQEVPEADGWEPESGDLAFVGYLVTLDLF
jgi:hypothetical protein